METSGAVYFDISIFKEIPMDEEKETSEDAKPDYSGVVFAGTKDGENYGFYLPDSVLDEDGTIGLSDFVILTNAEHMALMDGQSAGKVITFHKGEKPTLEDPPPPSDEEIAESVRRERDALIEAVQWRIQRYEQQTALGLETTDSTEVYETILVYVQELRDLPSQSGFPRDVVFPVLAV